MPSRIFSAALHGVDAEIVTVETDITHGLHYFHIVGLPDKSVDESRDRVNSALKNSGFDYPKKSNQKIIINLAPANIKKEGSSYDLPIAISYLAASRQITVDCSSKLFVGELALDGSVRPVEGALSIVARAKAEGFSEAIIPFDNYEEASLISGIGIIPLKNLTECADYLLGKIKAVSPPIRTQTAPTESDDTYDFMHIKGQEQAKRALEIAAAGGHNILMSGPPGSGKTMLARALISILPNMSEQEVVETTTIHSVAGVLTKKQPIVTARPFRAPHHSASAIALIGGGEKAKPGEITLAHNGVLFLDEFPEFQKNVIEALRQPLEHKTITVSRAYGSFLYPARFMLVATKNPCPCGYYQSNQRACTCSLPSIMRYQKKISGPIADRIDMHVEVPAVEYEKLVSREQEAGSATIRKRVAEARTIQRTRFAANNVATNADMPPKAIKTHCVLDRICADTLKKASEKLNLTARSYHKVIKIARTIADLAMSENIRHEHILEALQYRPQTV